MAAGCGLNSMERVIMDLWEAGRSFEQIEAATTLKRDTIRSVVSMFRVDGPEDRDREAAIRSGSRRYAAALTATGKVYA